MDKFAQSLTSGAFQATSEIDVKALFSNELRDQTEIVVEELRQTGTQLEIKARRTDASTDRFKVTMTDGLLVGTKEKIEAPKRVRPSQ